MSNIIEASTILPTSIMDHYKPCWVVIEIPNCLRSSKVWVPASTPKAVPRQGTERSPATVQPSLTDWVRDRNVQGATAILSEIAAVALTMEFFDLACTGQPACHWGTQPANFRYRSPTLNRFWDTKISPNTS